MIAKAFNIYPRGRGCFLPNDQLYLVARHIISKFAVAGFQAKDGYSILLYGPDCENRDCVKVEIYSDQTLAGQVSLEGVLHEEKKIHAIDDCDSPPPDDQPADIKLKLLATAIREGTARGDPFAEQLVKNDFAGWAAIISGLAEKIWGGQIVLRFLPGGITTLDKKQFCRLVHLILNPLGYEVENRIRQQCGMREIRCR